MKTVIDAVNELKGDLSNTYKERVERSFLFFNTELEHYICDNSSYTVQGRYQYRLN